MNIIFLDVDGVLNDFGLMLFTDEEIDPVKLEMISDICEKHNCKIVLSSSWRHGMDEETLRCDPESAAQKISDALREHNCPLIGRTKQLNKGRACDIIEYVHRKLTPEDNYLILDDENIIEFNGITYDEIAPHFLRTRCDLGFTFEDYKKADEFFKGNKDWRSFKVNIDC